MCYIFCLELSFFYFQPMDLGLSFSIKLIKSLKLFKLIFL